MISCTDSVVLAVQELRVAYDEWLYEEDGVCVYVDFKFATRELFHDYQRRIEDDKTDTIRQVQFGRSYLPFPCSIRTYFLLAHEKYPYVECDDDNEELYQGGAKNKKRSFAAPKNTPPPPANKDKEKKTRKQAKIAPAENRSAPEHVARKKQNKHY